MSKRSGLVAIVIATLLLPLLGHSAHPASAASVQAIVDQFNGTVLGTRSVSAFTCGQSGCTSSSGGSFTQGSGTGTLSTSGDSNGSTGVDLNYTFPATDVTLGGTNNVLNLNFQSNSAKISFIVVAWDSEGLDATFFATISSQSTPFTLALPLCAASGSSVCFNSALNFDFTQLTKLDLSFQYDGPIPGSATTVLTSVETPSYTTTTTTAASATATYSTSDQQVALSAAVTPSTGTVNEGTVTFTVQQGSTVIGSATTSSTVSNGNAAVNYTLPGGTAAGTYTILASYSDSGGSFANSSDNTHTLTISAASTTTAAASATATYSSSGQNVTLNATVTSGGGTVGAGTVTFTLLQGSTVIGTATTGTVSSGAVSVTYALPAATPGGTYTVQAVYNGSTNFAGSSDTTHTLTITAAVLAITKTASPTTFTQGDVGDSYTITVSNTGTVPTSGLVTMTDTLPTVANAPVATALSGTGWTCTLGTLSCTRSDALAAGSSYPPIALTVSVPLVAPLISLTNTATVTGGGDAATHQALATVTVQANPASCAPATGFVAVKSSVSCSFSSGNGNVFSGWSATGTVTPATSTSLSQAFTVLGGSTLSIQASWTDAASHPQSRTFSYTVGSPPPVTQPTVNCSPSSGTVASSATVSCSFVVGSSGATLTGWSAVGFTPTSSSGLTLSFTAGAALKSASITVQWLDAASQAQSQVFSYSISGGSPPPPPPTVSCSPSGGSVLSGSTVTCIFVAGSSGATFTTWTASGFTPTPTTSLTPTFTAGAAAKTATITAQWTDAASQPQSQVFSFSISGSTPPSPPTITCNPSGGTVTSGSTVNCSFTVGASGATLTGWTASGFTPTSSTSLTPGFLAGAATKVAVITVQWLDAASQAQTQAFTYTIASAP